MTTPEKYARIIQLINKARDEEKSCSETSWVKAYGFIYRTLFDLDPEAFKKDIEATIRNEA